MYETETAHIVRKAYSERCRFNVHGHSYKWIVSLKSWDLDDAGMVVDFGNLKWIKQYVDQFDHTMVLWKNDDEEFKQFFLDNCKRVIIMNENTTAENMAKLLATYIFTQLKDKYGGKVQLDNVQVFETRTGSAIATTQDVSLSEATIVYIQND